MKKNALLTVTCIMLLIVTSKAQWSSSSNRYLFGGNGSNPGNATASIYDQAYIGPTINGQNISFRTGVSGSNYERMRITSDGYVGIGTSNPTKKLHVNGSSFINADLVVQTQIQCQQLYETSDIRYKTEIKEEMNAYLNLYDLKTYRYKLLSANNYDYGVIAQEVMEYYPELVKGDDTAGYSVRYTGMVPLLIRAVQDQKQTIDALKERLDKMEMELNRATNSIQNTINSIYPNPAHGIVNIELKNNLNGDSKIEIFNLNGQRISSIDTSSKSKVVFETKDMLKGVYFFKFIRSGKLIETSRIVIE